MVAAASVAAEAAVAAATVATMTTVIIAAERARTADGCSKCNGDGSGDGGGRGDVDGRCKGCIEMAVVVFRGSGDCAAMSVDGGGGDGVFAVAMTSSGHPCP